MSAVSDASLWGVKHFVVFAETRGLRTIGSFKLRGSRMETEGVTKFTLDYRPATPLEGDWFGPLNAWRRMLYELGLIGVDPARYGGVGFGNVSARIDGQGFVITGTQTGARAELTRADYVLVRAADVEANRVVASGPCPPSSESLTHAMLYALDPAVRFVFHVHDPGPWGQARRLDLAVTDRQADYGTPAMAHEVARLMAPGTAGVIAMGGHEDGIIAWGSSADEAGMALTRLHAAARALD